MSDNCQKEKLSIPRSHIWPTPRMEIGSKREHFRCRTLTRSANFLGVAPISWSVADARTHNGKKVL